MLFASRLVDRFQALVFPVNCLGCDRESDWLCPDCRGELIVSRTEICKICGKSALAGLCQACQAKLKLDGLISLFGYRQPLIQRIIKQGKYGGQVDSLRFLTSRYRRELLKNLPDGDWTLIPIPLARDRLATRGFNQAGLIAQALADDHYPVVNLLRRIRATEPQVGLTKTKRRVNLRRAFELKTKLNLPERVLLIDDVATTGTTLSEAAKALRRAKIPTVWALTLAHG